MPIMSAAKSKLFIGTALAQKNEDFVEADFNALTFTQVQPLEGLGTLGDTAEPVTFDSMGSGRRKKMKGIRDAGDMQIVLGLDMEDAGQIALIAAEKQDGDFAFKLVTPSGDERYFIAMVMSVAEAYDSANSIVKLNATLAVNSNVVRVAA